MNDFKQYILSLAEDSTVSVNDRIEEIMSHRDRSDKTEKVVRLSKDRIIFRTLFDMLNALPGHDHDEEKIQLLTLLGETSVALNDFRQLRFVGENACEIMRDELLGWDILKAAVPRIAKALEYANCYHAIFEILLRFMRAAITEGVDLGEIRNEAEMVVRLRILLTDFYETYLFDAKIMKALESIFSSNDLIRIINRPDPGHLRRDPVEYTWEWEQIICDVEEELDRRFANHPKGMGFCFLRWNAKRDLLKEKYGIEWKSPSLMNPRVMFD